MYKLKLFLLLLLIPLAVFAAAVPKTQVYLLGHVTQRMDNSPAVAIGYNFYVRTAAGSFDKVPTLTVPESTSVISADLVKLIPPPAKGNYSVIATAYDAQGEGLQSNQVTIYAVGDGSFFLQAPLGAPGELLIR
jgi:hypothetical protein